MCHENADKGLAHEGVKSGLHPSESTRLTLKGRLRENLEIIAY